MFLRLFVSVMRSGMLVRMSGARVSLVLLMTLIEFAIGRSGCTIITGASGGIGL